MQWKILISVFFIPALIAPVPSFVTQAAETGSVKVAAVQISGYDKKDLPRDGFAPVEKLIPYINQAYGGGTMIADCSRWPVRIIESTPYGKETYITATINLNTVREMRSNSRNFMQRRPDLYGEIVKPIKGKEK